MAFITHCWKKPAPELRRWLLLVALLCLGVLARAQSVATQAPLLKLERKEDAVVLSTQLAFELPSVVEDALLKGIPIIFVARVDVVRERWYWANKRIATAERRMRLSYHPLTRRWRLNLATGETSEATQGLALNQNFETLADALATVRRISHWKIADLSDVEPGGKYQVEFEFQLDVTQLPRPLQIGTLGQSDWLISLSAAQALQAELLR